MDQGAQTEGDTRASRRSILLSILGQKRDQHAITPHYGKPLFVFLTLCSLSLLVSQIPALLANLRFLLD